MLEPLIMSKQVFDACRRTAGRDHGVGAEMEEFGTKEAMADDQKVSEVYAKKGVQGSRSRRSDRREVARIARDTAWKDYAGKTPLSAELIKLAEACSVS